MPIRVQPTDIGAAPVTKLGLRHRLAPGLMLVRSGHGAELSVRAGVNLGETDPLGQLPICSLT